VKPVLTNTRTPAVSQDIFSPMLKRESGISPVHYQTSDDDVEVIENISTVSEYACFKSVSIRLCTDIFSL